MTVADDLATLQLAVDESRIGQAALARVEAEIARLRDGLRNLADEAESYVGIGFDTANESERLMASVSKARALLAEDGAT